MVCNYNRYLKFKDWLIILEDYLNTYYYYGIKNEFRKDKKHISEWDGTLKRHAGNFKNNNLYEWYRKIKKRNLKDSELIILNSLGLKLNNKISERLTFNQWVSFIKEYKEHIGDKWDGIIKTNTYFKNRNIYTFLNAIRHKSISKEQELILKEIGLRNYKIM